MISIMISKIFSLVGLQIVDKKIYRKNYFRKESNRIMQPVAERYLSLVQGYKSLKINVRSVENQPLFLKVIYSLGLQKMAPIHILEIGGRDGLFSYLCQYYGHKSYTTDCPGVFEKSPYKQLIALLKVNYFTLKVKSLTPIDVGKRKFDLVVGFKTRFHSIMPCESGKKYEEHWGVKEWDFFLHDLATNVLTENGRIYFMLNRLQEKNKKGCVPPELADYFRRNGGKLRQNTLYFPTLKYFQRHD